MIDNHFSSFFSLLSSKRFLFFILFFIITFSFFAIELIQHDAFDMFYEYSRTHEDWELDEWIMVIISFFISLSLVLFVSSIYLVKKIIQLTNEEMKKEKKLQQSQKLEAMGTLLGGLAHSLNNHLLPIITISRIIKEETPKGTPTYQDIEKVLDAAESSSQILKQVLNFAREDNSILFSSSILDQTLNKTLDLIEAAIPKTIKLVRNISDTNVIIPMTRVNFEIVIFNFINNSVDALENKADGKIEISADIDEENNKVDIIIEDNGHGISQKEIRKIFDPFFTTKPEGKGTGLGLAETYGIINNANGEIKVDSKEGEFTRFIIRLPIQKEV